jgi:hypothetical protein
MRLKIASVRDETSEQVAEIEKVCLVAFNGPLFEGFPMGK